MSDGAFAPEPAPVTKWGERGLVLVEKLGDWVNPILVKEARQSLKSRQFASTFMLLLLASWVVSVFGVVWQGNSLEYGQAGRTFFWFFFVVLSVASLVIVPFTAFRSLLNERDESTYELLSITALTPKQIVWGKLLSALLQVFLFYSAIAPFVAFTSLLQGFDFAQVSYLMTLLVVASLGYSMIALVLSTFAKQKHTQIFTTVAMLGLAGWGFMLFLGASFGTLMMSPFDSAEFWIGNGLGLVAFVSYFVLFLQIATAQLTFDADNRSTGIRITLSVQFFLFWICVIAYDYFQGTVISNDEVLFCATLSGVHWLIGGLFAVTESDTLSRRILKKRPLRRDWRMLLAPFLPGGARGYFYVCLHLAALWLIVFFVTPAWTAPLTGISRGGSMNPLVYTTALCSYILIYLGMAALLGRLLHSLAADIRPGHVRMISIILSLLGLIFPYIIRIFELRRNWDYAFFDILDPFRTLSEISKNDWAVSLVYLLMGMAFVAIVVNTLAMKKGLSDAISMDGEVEQQAEPRNTATEGNVAGVQA